MSSKQVEIKRHYGFIHAANPDNEAKEYFDMAYKAIGSYFKVFGKIYASGLTRQEEEYLMPDLVGAYPEDRKEFREKVNNYFKNINTKIPAEGVKLEIGLEGSATSIFNSKGEQVGNPINVEHYVKYKHALKHPHVCDSLEAAERMGNLAHFYILDKQEETKAKSKINRLEDEASQFYFANRDDVFKVDQMLTLLGITTKYLDNEEKVIKLKEMSSKDIDQTDKVNADRLNKFINIAKDKDLGLKYDIMQMIRFNILERVKYKILDAESGELVGDNLKEAVLWFKDKSNSKQVNVYYAGLNEKGTSTQNYSPPEEKEIEATPVEIGESDLSGFNAEDETETTES